MENKQTALDWLINEISYEDDGEIYCKFIERTDLSVYFALAKAMEKEQLLDFFMIGQDIGTSIQDAEETYNETYGKDNV